MTTKKTVSLVMAALLAVAAMFTFTACGGKELTGIEITTEPTKVQYVQGETFSPDGMVVSKVYSDKSKAALTDEEHYDWDLKGALKLKDTRVTVSYTENEKTYKASVNIKVTNNVARVNVVTQPETTDYIAGQKFDPTGMTIKAVYEDGTEGETLEVTEDAVTYKTTGLVKSDEHFEMVYGGCKFYLDITVLHGAFLEAEAGQVAGARITDAAPNTNQVELDHINALGNTSDGQRHRGIDQGKKCTEVGYHECYNGEAECTISGPRGPINYYVYNHLEWTETTGGVPAKSGMMQKNHVYFKRAGEKMLYRLSADKAGKVILTFKMANPNITGSTAAETLLSDVFKLSVGTTVVDIPATSKLEEIDWSMYKAYNKAADYDNKDDSDLYTGDAVVPLFRWQNVSVEINVKEGINDLTVESIWNGNEDYGVRLDSISCNADADEITISLNSEFKPVVKHAQLKVEGEKVLMGVVVDARAVNYTDEEVIEFLQLTKAATVGNATYSGNTVGGKGENGETIKLGDDYNDPWTQPKDRGGLGYAEPPYAIDLNGNGNATRVSYKDNMGGKGNVDSVEKITEGVYSGYFCVWFDVTIPAENSDNYVGVWTFSNFNYGTEFEASKPDGDILKTDENVTAELGGYCYQTYCDARDVNVAFGWSNLCLVVQKGSFEGEGACNKLMRRYVGHLTDNDQELIDMRG